MSQDPAEPETFDEFLENAEDAEEYEEELDEEASEGDAAEQRLELLRLRDTPLTERSRDDANPADTAEQARVIDPGDDDYR